VLKELILFLVGFGKYLPVFAHNGGKFDYKVLLTELFQLVKEEFIHLDDLTQSKDGDIFLMDIAHLGRNSILSFRDSFKLLPRRVDNLAKTFLSRSNKISVYHRIIRRYLMDPSKASLFNEWRVKSAEIFPSGIDRRKYRTPKEYLIAYCVNDCMIIGEVIRVFAKTLKSQLNYDIIVGTSISISSVANRLFLRKFYSTPIIDISTKHSMFDFISKSYYGGRTEVFNVGVNLPCVYHFDVPGMYAECIKGDLPVGNPVLLSNVFKDIGTREFKELLQNLHKFGIIGFFQGLATTPKDIEFPILPVKNNDKLLFPKGCFSGV